MENITRIGAQAVRAKEEYLFTAGRNAQKEIEDLRQPVSFEDKYDQQWVWAGGKFVKVEEPKPERIVRADRLDTFSLDGLVKFIIADPEGMFKDPDVRHIVLVENPTKVTVIAPQRGFWREREEVAMCNAVVPEIRFGRFMDTDEFQIMVQTCFAESENRAKVLQLSGSIRKEQNMQTADDGVSQRVTINAGVSTAADVIVKNPVTLIPFRTFHEIEQPESPFVLRFNEDGEAALFTGDGFKWKLEAVKKIREYLEKALEGQNVTVIA